jgi:hypothetical protein
VLATLSAIGSTPIMMPVAGMTKEESSRTFISPDRTWRRRPTRLVPNETRASTSAMIARIRPAVSATRWSRLAV